MNMVVVLGNGNARTSNRVVANYVGEFGELGMNHNGEHLLSCITVQSTFLK